jgi:hypothetical protein
VYVTVSFCKNSTCLNDFPVRRFLGSFLSVEAIIQAVFFGETLGYVFDGLAVDRSACWYLAAGTLVTHAVDWDICLSGGQTILNGIVFRFRAPLRLKGTRTTIEFARPIGKGFSVTHFASRPQDLASWTVYSFLTMSNLKSLREKKPS